MVAHTRGLFSGLDCAASATEFKGPITWQISARAGNFSPVKRAEKPHVIAFKFRPGLKYKNLGMRTTLVVHKNKSMETLSCKFSRPILNIAPSPAPGLTFAM